MSDETQDHRRGEAPEETRQVEQEVEIEAPAERVWRALTEARELERWFPLEARVEPGEGGEIFMSWKNEFAGTSKILAWDPPSHLRVSWGGADDASAQVTDYFIESRGGSTRLRVVTSGFPTDASWDDWVEGTRLGWLFELASLKRYLEHHDGRGRQVVYLRRRVDLSRPEAWDRLFGAGGLDAGDFTERTLHREPPRQLTALTRTPEGGLLRISTEPAAPGVEGMDVTLFLSGWGEAGNELVALEDDWRSRLEELLPEGKTM